MPGMPSLHRASQTKRVMNELTCCTRVALLTLSMGNCQPYSANLNGGASRARTDGLVVANDALSQLSYSPTCRMDG